MKNEMITLSIVKKCNGLRLNFIFIKCLTKDDKNTIYDMLGLVSTKNVLIYLSIQRLKVRNGGFLDEDFSYDFSRGAWITLRYFIVRTR